MAKTYNTISTFTSGQVLTAAQMNAIGTNVNNYRVPPAAKVQRITSNLAVSVGDYVQWNQQNFDTEEPGDNIYDSGSNTRLTIKTPGLYLVQWNVNIAWNGNASGQSLQITQTTSGGTETAVAQDYYFYVTTGFQFNYMSTISTLANAVAGDYFRCKFAELNGGSSYAVVQAPTSTFSVMWQGQVS